MAIRQHLLFSLIGAAACAIAAPALAQGVGPGSIDGVLGSARGAAAPKPPSTGLFSSIFGCSASGVRRQHPWHRFEVVI